MLSFGELVTVADWTIPLHVITQTRSADVCDGGSDSGGVIFRTMTELDLVTEVDFKPANFVRFEKIRTDYAPMTVAGKSLVAPVWVFANSELIANGETFTAQ